MVTRYLFLFGLGLMAGPATAQTLQLNRTGGSVVVGSDGSAASASAALEVKSTSQGVLLPRLTTAQRTAISNAANGLLVFDTDTQSFWFRQNGAWVNLVGGGSSGAGVGWQQTGANISNTNSGNVGIGTTNPLAKLSVVGSSRSATGTNTADFANTNLGPNVSFVHLGSKGHWLIRSAADSGNVVMQDINRGRVGIGTAFPNSTLSIVGRQATTNASNTVDISNTAVGPNVSFIHYGATGDWLIRSAAYSGNVIMQDFPGGRVGIGTAFPGSTLSVQGRQNNLAASNTAEFSNPLLGPNISHIHYGSYGDWYIRSADNAGRVILQDVSTNGRVGIGTSNPQAKLDINGNTIMSGPLAVRSDISFTNALTSSALPGLNLRPIGLFEISVFGYDDGPHEPVIRQVPANLFTGQLVGNASFAVPVDLAINPALLTGVRELYLVGGIQTDFEGSSSIEIAGDRLVRVYAYFDGNDYAGLRAGGVIYAVY
nr:hypothetical protein [uncultured Arsenicibacter sp.]